MSRTVIYRAAGDGGGQVAFATGGGTADTSDGYVDKLIKYVPAEVVAFFAPTAAMAGTDHRVLFGALIAGTVATPIYLWYQSRGLPAASKPVPPFFLIATIAFLVWALATSPEMATTVHLDARAVALVLGITILFVPVLDAVLAELWSRLRQAIVKLRAT